MSDYSLSVAMHPVEKFITCSALYAFIFIELLPSLSLYKICFKATKDCNVKCQEIRGGSRILWREDAFWNLEPLGSIA